MHLCFVHNRKYLRDQKFLFSPSSSSAASESQASRGSGLSQVSPSPTHRLSEAPVPTEGCWRLQEWCGVLLSAERRWPIVSGRRNRHHRCRCRRRCRRRCCWWKLRQRRVPRYQQRSGSQRAIVIPNWQIDGFNEKKMQPPWWVFFGACREKCQSMNVNLMLFDVNFFALTGLVLLLLIVLNNTHTHVTHNASLSKLCTSGEWIQRCETFAAFFKQRFRQRFPSFNLHLLCFESLLLRKTTHTKFSLLLVLESDKCFVICFDNSISDMHVLSLPVCNDLAIIVKSCCLSFNWKGISSELLLSISRYAGLACVQFRSIKEACLVSVPEMQLTSMKNNVFCSFNRKMFLIMVIVDLLHFSSSFLPKFCWEFLTCKSLSFPTSHGQGGCCKDRKRKT